MMAIVGINQSSMGSRRKLRGPPDGAQRRNAREMALICNPKTSPSSLCQDPNDPARRSSLVSGRSQFASPRSISARRTSGFRFPRTFTTRFLNRTGPKKLNTRGFQFLILLVTAPKLEKLERAIMYGNAYSP